MALVVEQYIIRYIAFSRRHLSLYHRVSALFDVYDERVVYLRTDIPMLPCCLCEREHAVEMGNHVGISLYLWYKSLGCQYQFSEEPFLGGEYLLISTQYLLFIFFQLLSDISFCLGQRLLSYPLGRHLILVCVPDLEIVAKNIIISYLQTTDTRLCHLTFLYL